MPWHTRFVPGDSFQQFVLDQLATLTGLRARAMFGGHGLYSGGKFFGILFEGRVYFKVDAGTRATYEAHDMGPFTYETPRRTFTMSYYEVPADVLENRDELLEWASVAIAVAGNAKQVNAPKRQAGRSRGRSSGSSPSASRARR